MNDFPNRKQAKKTGTEQYPYSIKEKTHFTDEYFRFISSLNQSLKAFFSPQ